MTQNKAVKFGVTILQPLGYAPSLVFLEAAEYVLHVIRRLGYCADFRKNRIIPGRINVVFGAHLQLQEDINLPEGTIIFNTEQLLSDSKLLTAKYWQLLNENYVWDYSSANLACIRHDRKSLFPFTYIPEMVRDDPKKEKDIDLVFYGTMNPRRREIIGQLKSNGLLVREINGLFGPERDEIMFRSKAVLNLHYFQSQIFQQIRCFYPLTQGIPVVSEPFTYDSAPEFYHDCVITSKKPNFASSLKEMFASSPKFDKISKAKIEKFKATENSSMPKQAIDRTLSHIAPSIVDGNLTPFARLNLGSGKDYKPNWLNLDVDDRVRPDVNLDLSKEKLLPIKCTCDVFGSIELSENTFELIEANNVLGHVENLTQMMKNCLDLLREGGTFSILVSYDLSSGASQDPTQVRSFNQNSWLYYTDWARNLGWAEFCFDLTHTEYILSQFGQKLYDLGTELDEILKTPRAVDCMKVTLKKRRMSPAERTLARTYSQDWLCEETDENRLVLDLCDPMHYQPTARADTES